MIIKPNMRKSKPDFNTSFQLPHANAAEQLHQISDLDDFASESTA
jgi:hypothetical protein